MTSHGLLDVVVVPFTVFATEMSTTKVMVACGDPPNEPMRVIAPLLLDTRCSWSRCCCTAGVTNPALSEFSSWPGPLVTTFAIRWPYVAGVSL